jgi:predicted DNA-binding transcriptional regulator AlpA
MLVLLRALCTLSGHHLDHLFLKLIKSSLDLHSTFTTRPYAISYSLMKALLIYTRFTHLAATRGLRGCETIRRFSVILSKHEEKMTDKIWLTDTEVGTRFGSTRQWVWTQARNNPQFPRPVKITPRWSRWCLQEIEAFEHEARAARG